MVILPAIGEGPQILFATAGVLLSFVGMGFYFFGDAAWDDPAFERRSKRTTMILWAIAFGCIVLGVSGPPAHHPAYHAVVAVHHPHSGPAHPKPHTEHPAGVIV